MCRFGLYWRNVFSAVSLVLFASSSFAIDVEQSQAITHLLEFVRTSGCQFKRNGTWHDSESAANHIQRKYDYANNKGVIADAEDFIQYAATESSWTGIDYVVKCPKQSEQTSSDWLHSELTRYRSKK